MKRYDADSAGEGADFGGASQRAEERLQLAENLVSNLWRGLGKLRASRPTRPYRYDRRLAVMSVQPGPYLAR